MTNRIIPDRLSVLFEPELVAIIQQQSNARTVEAGTVLMQPGLPILHVPIVLEGSIKITRVDDEGAEILLYYLRPDDACALSFSSLLTNQNSPIRAIAEDRTLLLMIPARMADDWIGRFASWRNFVFQTYQRRFDNLLVTLDSVAFRQMDQRLVDYLDSRARLTGGRHLYLTHEEIARDLNTSREVISRLLKQLERLERVRLSRNKISLL